jgi:hypothetical protein
MGPSHSLSRLNESEHVERFRDGRRSPRGRILYQVLRHSFLQRQWPARFVHHRYSWLTLSRRRRTYGSCSSVCPIRRGTPSTTRFKSRLCLAKAWSAPEHLVLGLLDDPDSFAGRALRSCGLSLENGRRVLRATVVSPPMKGTAMLSEHELSKRSGLLSFSRAEDERSTGSVAS